MRNGDVLSLRIASVDADGWGIAHHEGREVLVAGALPDERVEAVIEATSRHHARAWARVDTLRGVAATRTTPPCHHAWPVAGRCGGCPLMHMTYEASVQTKQDALHAALAGVVDEGVALPRLRAAAQPQGWRNRTHLLAFRSKSGRPRLGSRGPRGVEMARMDGCRAVHPSVRATADALAAWLTTHAIPLADDAEGGLHGVQVRTGTDGGTLVELVTFGPPGAWLEPLAARIATLPDVRGVAASEHDRQSNRTRSSDVRTVAGAPEVDAHVAGLAFRLDATVFFQLHFEVADAMARAASALVGSADVALDLYGGTGLLGLAWARGAAGRRVVLIESEARALDVARATATQAGIALDAIAGDLRQSATLDALTDLPATTPIFVDPPRAGLSDAVLAFLASRPHAPIVYMSCSATTFARDVARLRSDGRALASLDAWDMMPFTPHVELLGALTPHR